MCVPVAPQIGVSDMAVCEEERFNNAFFLLKKTIEFLSTEYDMHFVILSAYQSLKTDSVVAYTSPGPAAKFFTENHSSKPSTKEFLSVWESFAKTHCLSGNEAHVNVPSYTAFLKSDSAESRCKLASSNASPAIQVTEMPEPPADILSETMYFCNGEFRSAEGEDSENTDTLSPKLSKNCSVNQLRALSKQAMKRKSLQAVSDQLAKKAVAVNYYRPIYPAAPKVVTPTVTNSSVESSVLNLSNGNIGETNKPIITSVSSLLAAKPTYNGIKSSAASPLPNGRVNGHRSPAATAENKKNAMNSDNTGLLTNINTESLLSPSKNYSGSPKQTWPCTVCSKDFASQSTMKRHLNHFHLKVHSYTCNYCNDIFYRKDKLVAHIKIKHGIDTSRSARLIQPTAKTSPTGGSLDPLSPVSSSLTSGSPVSSPGGGSNSPSNANTSLIQPQPTAVV